MEVFLSLISIYLIINIYFCKRDLLKPILFCMFSCIGSAILFEMGKPELGIMCLTVNVFMTALLILISLHFAKYNLKEQAYRKSYKLPLSLISLVTLLGVFIVEIDRNYDSFIYDGNDKVMSLMLLETSLLNNSYSIILISLMMLICSVALVFMFRKERID